MQTESNPPSPVVGWKPKGYEQGQAIANMYQIGVDNEYPLSPITVKALKNLGILEALCDPVREPEKKEWKVEESSAGNYYLRKGTISLHVSARNSNRSWSETAQDICDQLNQPAPSQPTDEEIGDKWGEIWRVLFRQLSNLSATSFPTTPARSHEQLLHLYWRKSITRYNK